MKKTILVIVAAFMAFTALPASASIFASGNNYDLTTGQTVNSNLYSAGGNINIAGAVNGDAFLAGGSIISTGKISNDLNIAGGNITVSGPVGDDLRVTGGSVNIASKIGGEVLAGGGQVQMTSESSVNKDATFAGGSVVLNGTINGNALIYGQKVELLGTINGNAKIQTSQLTIGPQTIIKGTLNYSAPSEIQIPSSAQIGKVNFTKLVMPVKNNNQAKTFIGAFWFYKVIATIIAALILYFIFKRGTTNLVQGSLKHFWMKVLYGFATLILIPIAGLIVAVTIVGLPFSAMAALIYFLLFGIAAIGAGVVFGTWIFSLFSRTTPEEHRVTWVTIIVGIAVLSIISLIPLIGWLASLIFMLAIFGEMWHQLYHGLAKIR